MGLATKKPSLGISDWLTRIVVLTVVNSASEENTATGKCKQSKHSEINASLKAELKSIKLTKLCRQC